MGIKESPECNPSYKDSDVYRPGAFNPGLFELNKKELKALRPQIFGLRLERKKGEMPQVKWEYVEALARQHKLFVSLSFYKVRSLLWLANPLHSNSGGFFFMYRLNLFQPPRVARGLWQNEKGRLCRNTASLHRNKY